MNTYIHAYDNYCVESILTFIHILLSYTSAMCYNTILGQRLHDIVLTTVDLGFVLQCTAL